jgi:hypothetical protein
MASDESARVVDVAIRNVAQVTKLDAIATRTCQKRELQTNQVDL